MVGSGPLINVGPIVAGGVAGPVGGALITERVRDALVRGARSAAGRTVGCGAHGRLRGARADAEPADAERS